MVPVERAAPASLPGPGRPLTAATPATGGEVGALWLAPEHVEQGDSQGRTPPRDERQAHRRCE
eukprot:637606-Pyramimonas_sp.AAC.1